jgi:hypothetical protein
MDPAKNEQVNPMFPAKTNKWILIFCLNLQNDPTLLPKFGS